MNRIDRISAILIQLQSKRVVTAGEIAGRFEISIRTVYRDIRTLEAAGIPIGSEAGLGYYLVEGYHLPPVAFTTEEAGALVTAGIFVDRFTDASFKAHYDSAMYKIRSVLKSQDKDYVEALQSRVGIYGPAREQDAPGPDFLSTIEAAICRKRVVAMEYAAPGRPPVCRNVEPLALGLYESHWHLLAYCRLRGEFRDFRLDRIDRLSVTEEHFQERAHGAFRNPFS